MSKIELKPCPFCGGEAKEGFYEGNQVSCPNCHVGISVKLIGCQYALHTKESRDDYDGYETVFQAIQIWNRRIYEKNNKKVPNMP